MAEGANNNWMKYYAIGMIAFLLGRESVEEKSITPQRLISSPTPSSIKADPGAARSESSSAAPPPESIAQETVEPSEATEEQIYFARCADARAAGYAPMHLNEPGYSSHLDRDGDGVACE